MKKVLLLASTLLLAFGLTGCFYGNDPDPDPDPVVLESVTLSNMVDDSIMVDDVFDVFALPVATGSDGVDYTANITANSDNCTIGSDGILDTSIQGSCIIEYSVVAEGKLDRESITITIEAEVVVVDPNAALVKGWTFDDDDALIGWTKYEAGGGSVTESIDEGTLKLEIVSGGLIYESRFEYMGIPLENGTDYNISFKAKSSVAGKILHFQFGELLSGAPWYTDFKPGQVDDFTLTEEWVEYSWSFTMTIDNVNGGPLFEMGNMEGSMDIDCTIWIDDLEIRGGSAEDTSAPAFTGTEAVTTYLNDVFDPLEGVVANDFVDGVVTGDIVVSGDTVLVDTVGTYTVTYTVSDAAGNEESVDRVVTVEVDVDAPVIAGIDDAVVAVGSAFDVLEGVTAMDNRDGDVTADIVVGGDTLDVNTAGDYSVTYTVEDALGNTVTETRVIIVNAMLFDPTDFVANGDFEAEWNPFYANWTDAFALYSITETGELEINISNVGPDFWSVLVEQPNLALVAGTTYQLSFDAMSSVARDIQVELADAGLAVQTLSLTTEMVNYTANFTVGEADVTAILKILMGTINDSLPSVVIVDNVKLEEYDGAAVVAETDLILDGGFDNWVMDGWSSWSRDWDPAITSSLNVEYGELVFRYDGAGDAGWQNQVNYEGLELEYGKTYKVSFSAKGDMARDFDVTFYDGAMDIRSAPMALGTEFVTYEFIFTWDSENTGLLQFELGKYGDVEGGVFYVDNVKIEKAQQEELLLNGDFEDSGWMTWMADWNTTDATVSYENGEITLDIVDVGSENWNIQLYQEGMTFVNGTQYIITFDAMSTVARDINVKLIAASEFTQMVSLTETMGTYTFIFTFTDPDGTGKLDFELGGAQGGILVSVPSVVTFDNIMVEEYDGAAVVADTNQVVNGDLSGGVDWGVWMADWNTTSANVSFLDGQFVIDITDVGAENWNIQLFQEGIELVNGMTYTVQFDAMSTVARDINLKMICAIEFTETFSLTTEMVTYTYTFVYTEADGLVKLDFEMGGVVVDGGILVSVPSVITIDNIKVFPNYN